MSDTSGPGPGSGSAEDLAAGGDDVGGGCADVAAASPDTRLSPEIVDELDTSAAADGAAADEPAEEAAVAAPAAGPAAAAAAAPAAEAPVPRPRPVNGATPAPSRGVGWCQGSPLERKRFFCREWVFAKLAHCLEARPASKTCGALVVGGPGTGKTALCCEAVWPAQGPTGRQQRALRRRLLAYHFCQAHDASTLSVADFIRRLVVQLQAVHQTHQQQQQAALPPQSLSAAAAAAYAEKVRTDPEIQAALQPDMLERDPDEALKRAVLFPLLELEPPRQCLFLLVDSLDEAGPLEVPAHAGGAAHRTSRTIGELLANHHHLFPQWLLLVVTARRQSKAVAKMFTGFRKISLDDLRKTQVVRDVQQYILARLDREDSLKQHISRDTAEMLNQLHIKSNGCFLYLEKVLDGVADNFIVLREVREIPGTLNGLYLWLCQRLFNRKQFAKVKPLLNVLLTTRRPLTRDELSACISTSLPNVTREYFNWRLHLLRRVLVTTGPVTTPAAAAASVPAVAAAVPSVPAAVPSVPAAVAATSPSAGTAARPQPQLLLFHHSFAEWLLDVKHCTQKYLCSASQGHAMLAMWYTMRAKHLSKEEVQTFAYHLSKLPPLPKPDKGEDKAAFDPHQFQVLWLIDSGAPVEDCLLPGENGKAEDAVEPSAPGAEPLPTLPRDPQVVRLLLDAGAAPPPKDDDDGDSAKDLGGAEDVEKRSVAVGGDGGEHPSVDDEGTSSQISEPSPASGALAELLGMLGMDRDINRADPSSGRTLLHALAAEGDSRLLELALQSCPEAELERTDRHGQTPLNLAARHGHADVVEVLLAGGARVDHADRDGWTALRAAAWGGHRQVVDLLLEAGAAVDYADMDQRTALRAAAWGGHEDIVLALLRSAPSGDHVNRTDDEGRTALIAAAYMGHAEIVEHLLEYGAEIDHADNDGRTALSVAALCVPANEGYAKVSVVNILLEKGASVDHQDKDGMTPLLVAAFEGHRDVCELLLESEADVDHADRCGRTPLWAAASMGHSTVVALLLFWGCYVDSIDNEGRTVLSVAAAQGNTEVVRQLLDRGLDEQHRDNSGWTPLHYAAFEGHGEVCEALLEGGARVEEPDNDGKGALMLAAQEGHVALVQDLLVRHAAPPDQKAHDGKTALRMAALEGHYEVVRCLIQSGADVDAKDADGRSCLYILALENRLPMARFLLDQGGADVESRDSEGRTPLHVSAWQGHVEMVALLLTVGGADVNSVDLENRTALHSASWQGNASIVRLLLEHRAAPDHTCNQGATALGIAAQEGHEACVRALLQHGADPNHSDRCGRNALRVAMKSGHENVVRLLEEFAASSRPHHLRLTTNGGSSGAASITSGASAETKQSSALLIPSAPLAHHNSISPIDSPDSTSKRRSFVSLGNHSSHSKSSSNLTGSTKSSHQESNNSHQLAALSFTQQLQQCTRGGKSRPLSRLLSPLQSEPQSPIYATPPHSPLSDVGMPASPMAVTPTGGVGSILADPHFTRDTHMRIILGNSSAGVGRNVKSGSDFNHSGGSGSKPKRNGIVTNPALRLVPGLKNGLDFASVRKGNSSARVTNSSVASPAAIVNSRPNGFQWRKETPL